MGAVVTSRRAATVFACAALALFGIAGCGEDDENADSNVDATATLGPQSAEGDIEASPATLRADDGYSTLVSTQVESRGSEDTLVASQVELSGSGEPAFRLTVDGKAEKGTQVDVSEDEGNRVAVVSCACKMSSGDHDVVLEAAAKGSTEKIGARTLVIFTEVQLDDTGAAPISGSDLVTDHTEVISEGADLAQTSTASGDGPLLVLASIASPRTGTGSENIRMEVEIGGDVTDEAAKTTIPTGKLVAYLDEDGAGDDVTLRGYTTSGRSEVGVASLITCNCGLAR